MFTLQLLENLLQRVKQEGSHRERAPARVAIPRLRISVAAGLLLALSALAMTPPVLAPSHDCGGSR